MIRAYRGGDIGYFQRKMQEQLTPEERDSIFTDRNRAWIPVMEEAVAEGGSPVFAVGAGHMEGEDGLIELLQKRGYTVDRIVDCATLFTGKAS